VAGNQAAIVTEVQAAVAQNAVVVVGMAQNPFCRKARTALTAAGVAFNYLEYGSYFSAWRERNALKMWTGWPTLPMVFVKGQLVGGANDLSRLIASGELKRLLG
jgi:glutaredoxin-related protein